MAGVEGLQEGHHQTVKACVSCHQISEYPEQPHNVAPQVLMDISQRLSADSQPVQSQMPALSCATCHQLHDSNGEASQLSDEQCQTCHVMPFQSFQHGHPEFADLPDISAQIVFDHRRHQEQHFDKKSLLEFAPQQCTDCHLTNADNDLQLAGFDSMCSDCHLQQDITTKLIDKIGPTSVFAVPRIDAETIDIGYWPNCQTTQFKRISNMPVLMKRLLESDPQAINAMTLLAADDITMNKALDEVSVEVQQAIIDLSESIRRLAEDIAAEDALERFSPASETREVENDRLSRLVAAIPVDVRRLLFSAWFVDSVEDGQAEACPSRDEWRAMRSGIEKGRDEVRSNSGWYLQAKSSYMALSYVPQGHADPLMRLISEVAADDQQWFDERNSFQCNKCHLINDEQTQQLVTVWPVVEDTRRSRFSHATHLVAGQSCVSCHQLSDADEELPFAVIDHLSIEKAQCDTCHQDGAVQQSCSDCHDYHWQEMFIQQANAPGLIVETKQSEDAG